MELYEWNWPSPSPHGTIALVHGAGEHCGRYEHVAQWLNNAGYAVLGRDLPGHGRSPGKRGHIDRFANYLATVDGMLDRLRTLYPAAPQFLYGHSMGGLIVVRWLQERPHDATSPLAGVVLTSPCLDLSLRVPPVLFQAASLIERVWPTMSQPSRIPPTAVSRRADIVAAYASDPLVERKVNVRWAMELQRSMARARERGVAFPVPTLILQAGADKLVSTEATRAFAESLAAPDKEYREFAGCYHELHNEPERDEVLATITSFLSRTLARSHPQA